MVKLHDILIDLKAQVGVISAQRSAAPTVVTDNRERPVRNTDGAPKKRSNPTPERGGNRGGQIPPTTMHGAGDPDPDDGDDDDDDEGQDPKGGPSGEKKEMAERSQMQKQGTKKKTSWTSWQKQSLENDCYIPNEPPTLHGYSKISRIRIFEYG